MSKEINAPNGQAAGRDIHNHFYGTWTALQPDEATLLANYRNSPKEAQDTLKEMSAALAQSKLGKAKAA